MERGGIWRAVDTEESMWCLEDDQDEHGEDVKTLMISLVRPPLTETEITWKKGELRAQPECLSQQGNVLLDLHDHNHLLLLCSLSAMPAMLCAPGT